VAGKEKLELLRSADIFAFPTYYPPEGHPWAIVEAMAAGLPIVSTDQGAITESVVHGRNGLIVEKRNPATVAQAIVSLCHDRDARVRMAHTSRQLYEENFTEARMVQRLAGVFFTVLADRRTAT
jgi:glycosyltransferase involved in cell wall biosynthesis